MIYPFTFRDSSGWKLAGTETFRASSSKIFGTYGGNRQNVNKKLRCIYKPDKNKILCQVDQSGAEALIVAYLCKDGNFRSLFLNKIKPHVYVALHVFKRQFAERFGRDLSPYTNSRIANLCAQPLWKELNELIKSSDKWEAKLRFYFIAKMICHACNYGMEARAFVLNVLEKSEGTVRLTEGDANAYLNIYHSLFPEIREWHKEVELTLRIHKKLKNLFNYPRYFFLPTDKTNLKEALAFIPQSTVGCITHIAITSMQNWIEDNNLDWDILNNCHDSYLVQCPVDEAKLCCTKMQEFINLDLVNFRGEKFKMKSEAVVGYNWSDMNEIKVN